MTNDARMSVIVKWRDYVNRKWAYLYYIVDNRNSRIILLDEDGWDIYTYIYLSLLHIETASMALLTDNNKIEMRFQI